MTTPSMSPIQANDLPNEMWQHIFKHVPFKDMPRCQMVCKLWYLHTQTALNPCKGGYFRLVQWAYKESYYLFNEDPHSLTHKPLKKFLKVEPRIDSLEIPSLAKTTSKYEIFKKKCWQFASMALCGITSTPSEANICQLLQERIEVLIPEGVVALLDFPIDAPLNTSMLRMAYTIQDQIVFFPHPHFRKTIEKLPQKNLWKMFVSKRILEYEESRVPFLEILAKSSNLSLLELGTTRKLTKSQKEYSKSQGREKVSIFKTIADSLKQLPNLMFIEARGIDLTNKDAAALAEFISSNPYKSICFYFDRTNKINAKGWNKLGEALSSSSQRHVLRINKSINNRVDWALLRRIPKTNLVIEITDS